MPNTAVYFMGGEKRDWKKRKKKRKRREQKRTRGVKKET
jgi:hypothetical protein